MDIDATDLDAIRARVNMASGLLPLPLGSPAMREAAFHLAVEDVPALLAEIDRLNALVPEPPTDGRAS